MAGSEMPPSATPPRSLLDRPGVRRGGLLTWLAAIAPVVYRVAVDPQQLGSWRVLTALAASALYLACWSRRLGPGPWPALLQVALAIAAFGAMPFPLQSAPTLVLLAVVAVPRLVYAGYERLGGAAIIVQAAALAWVYAGTMGSAIGLIAFVCSLTGLMLFAFSAARIVTAETRARAMLAASQSLLATGERLGERVRIARDLHDSIGHHLTTLSLHLDLARRQQPDDARRTIDTAHAVCRILLAEVRDVLRDVRRTDAEELSTALHQMAARVPGLDVSVNVDADLNGIDSERAHALLRCAQETITNALRHAGARRLMLTLQRTEAHVELIAEDDGRGLGGRRSGGGLDGAEDRLRRLGGGLTVDTLNGVQGTRIVASVRRAGGLVIRVFVADDQDLVRSGLCSLLALANDVEVVGEAGNGRETLAGLAALAAQDQPADVLLLDVRMPDQSGLDVLRELGSGPPAAIIVTTFPDDEALVTALQLGARGYLLKDSTVRRTVRVDSRGCARRIGRASSNAVADPAGTARCRRAAPATGRSSAADGSRAGDRATARSGAFQPRDRRRAPQR